MKIWKIFEKGLNVIAYVQVSENCTIFDNAYASLQLVRRQFPNNRSINGTQLLDVDRGEQMRNGIPMFILE